MLIADGAIALNDSDGNTLFTMTATKSYASVLISTPSRAALTRLKPARIRRP